MTSEASRSALGSQYDRFLFAPIGEDLNGLPLSVVSLLARLDLDPWVEAEHLAGLPTKAAASRLASSLETLKDSALRAASSETVVLRLLALLPKQVRAAIQPPAAAADDVGITPPDRTSRMVMLVLILSALALVGSRFVAAHREAAPRRDASHMPSAPATAPKPPLATPRP